MTDLSAIRRRSEAYSAMDAAAQVRMPLDDFVCLARQHRAILQDHLASADLAAVLALLDELIAACEDVMLDHNATWERPDIDPIRDVLAKIKASDSAEPGWRRSGS